DRLMADDSDYSAHLPSLCLASRGPIRKSLLWRSPFACRPEPVNKPLDRSDDLLLPQVGASERTVISNSFRDLARQRSEPRFEPPRVAVETCRLDADHGEPDDQHAAGEAERAAEQAVHAAEPRGVHERPDEPADEPARDQHEDQNRRAPDPKPEAR